MKKELKAASRGRGRPHEGNPQCNTINYRLTDAELEAVELKLGKGRSAVNAGARKALLSLVGLERV